MPRRCLGAWTAPGSHYPPYVSVNTDECGRGVTLTLREPPHGDRCGAAISVSMPRDDFSKFVAEMILAMLEINDLT